MTRSNQLPRNVLNCNPGNIKWNAGNAWKGQTGHDRDNFCIFKTTEFGARAEMKLLLTYYTEHHLLTIGQIIDRWSDDNDRIREDYKNFVSRRCGFPVHQPLYYYISLMTVASAIADFEAGENYPYPLLLSQGFLDALNGAEPEDALPLHV